MLLGVLHNGFERPLRPGSAGHQDEAAAKTLQAGGLAEYFTLKPELLIDESSWDAFWLPAPILLAGTGFNEGLVFRGVMQSASSDALGKSAILQSQLAKPRADGSKLPMAEGANGE